MLLGHNEIIKFYALLSSHESTNIKTGQRIISKQIMLIKLELKCRKIQKQGKEHFTSATCFRHAIGCELWLLNNHIYIQSEWTCCSINAYKFVVRWKFIQVKSTHPYFFLQLASPGPSPKKKNPPKNDLYGFPNMVGFFQSYFWETNDLLFNISFPFNLDYENKCIGLYKNDIILFIYML